MVHIERGSYVVEILEGNNSAELFWYYVIQRKGSNEVIDLVKFESPEQAIEGARAALERLNRAAAAGR